MRFIVYLCLALGLYRTSRAEDAASTWIYLPDEKARRELQTPMRLSLHSDGSATLDYLMVGVRRELEPLGKLQEGVQIKKEKDAVSLLNEKGQPQAVFKKLPDWELRFEVASPAPKTTEEALAILGRIVSPSIGELKREELVYLYFGLNTFIKTAFNLDDSKSPLLRDLAAKHGSPDVFDSKPTSQLLTLYWQSVQKNKTRP
jgi:hypothetical protein